MRFHVVQAILGRNFMSYFSGVLGYLFITVFVAVGANVAFSSEFFSQNQANLDQLTANFPFLLMFIVPAITMATWAEERRSGTEELLFTLPATDLEIVIGKYLAVLSIYSVALFFSFISCGILFLGILSDFQIDYRPIVATYIGYWLAGASLVTAGMFASSLTNSSTVAFVVGAVLCSIPTLLNRFVPNADSVQELTVAGQLRYFNLGLINFSGLFYFVSLAVFMLYLNLVMVSRRHWKPTELMPAHYSVRCLAAFVLFISLNIALANAPRIDMTAEGLFKLDKTTREAIRELDSKQPITIEAFVSTNVPTELRDTRSNLLGILRQLSSLGYGRIKLRVVHIEDDSRKSEEADRLGIFPRGVTSLENGRQVQSEVYLGVRVHKGADHSVVIPQFDRGSPVEYELTRAIMAIKQDERKKIGILTTDAKLFGGLNMSTFSQTPAWRFIEELKRAYDVQEVSPDAPISKVDVLIVAMASSLTEPQMENLVDYVRAGNPVLIFDDPLPAFNFSLAPNEQKPSQGGGGMFGGGGPPPQPKSAGGKATPLIRLLGLSWNNESILFDTDNPHKEIEDLVRKEIVFVQDRPKQSGFGLKSPISNGFQEVCCLFPGTIRVTSDSGLDVAPLLRSGPDSGVLAYDDLIERSMGMFPGAGPRLKNNVIYPRIENEDSEGESNRGMHVIAAHVSGESKETKLNAIYIADLDIISNLMFEIRDREEYGLRFDNVGFVFNCVDYLAGDERFLALRKRRAHQRPLLMIKKISERFAEAREKVTAEAKTEADEKLEEAQEKLNKTKDEIQKDKSLDEQSRAIKLLMAAESQSNQLSRQKEIIDKERDQILRQAKKDYNRKVRAMEFNTQMFATIISPLPVIVAGFCFLTSRLISEKSSVSRDRLRRT